MNEKRIKLLPEEGDVLDGRYRLNEEVGRGGFGVVFRATQVGLEEDVAIKIVRPHVIDDDSLRARFEREIFIAKQLRHPNTIRILDVSHTPTGLPYYVMEYVEGEALADTLEVEGRLNVARTRHIAIQLLKGLAEAHSKGVVHRDLKPENLLLCNFFGEPDFVKILDFGIAKALTGPVGKLTQTNALLGTPNYMSPEQALGSRDLDGRSDLYAVGLIMAECLSGRPVVEGESVLRVVATHASPEPLVLSPEVLNTPLAPVIQKALEKEPANRFPAAREMLEALAATGYDRPVSSPHGPTMDSPRPRRLETPPDIRPLQTPHTVRVGSSPAAAASPPDPMSETASAARPPTAPDLSQITARQPTPPGMVGFSQPHTPVRRKSWLVPLGLVIGLGGIIGALAFGPLSGGGDRREARERRENRPSAEAPATPDEAPAVPPALPDTPGQETLAPVEPVAEVAPELTAPSPVDPRVMAAVAIAGERLKSAMPAFHNLRFEGAPDVEVRTGEHVLGTTPFDWAVPRVARVVEVTLVRRGLPEELVQVRLDQQNYIVENRTRPEGRRNDRRDPQGREQLVVPPEEQQTPAIPGNLFGTAPIDDSGRGPREGSE